MIEEYLKKVPLEKVERKEYNGRLLLLTLLDIYVINDFTKIIFKFKIDFFNVFLIALSIQICNCIVLLFCSSTRNSREDGFSARYGKSWNGKKISAHNTTGDSTEDTNDRVIR